MTASMAEGMATILAEHRYLYGQRYGVERVEHCSCGWRTNSGARAWEDLAAHQAEQLAANGYGKLEEAWWLRQTLEALVNEYSSNSAVDRVITLGDIQGLLAEHPDRSHE